MFLQIPVFIIIYKHITSSICIRRNPLRKVVPLAYLQTHFHIHTLHIHLSILVVNSTVLRYSLYYEYLYLKFD